MRLLVLIMILLPSLSLRANTYYVATNGNNGNSGTINQPWATWGKAFQTATAGDTVYFRGGVYYVVSESDFGNITNSGTDGNRICFFAYPEEEPILDFINYSPGAWTYGVRVYGDSHLNFRGLTIRNLYQRTSVYVHAFLVQSSHDVILENITCHTISGPAFGIYGSDSVIVRNCDAYDLCDSLATRPGQNGDGFQWDSSLDFGENMYETRIYFEGCRAWDYGDNGFGGIGVGYVYLKDCWAFSGGRLQGDGCGFKYSRAELNDDVNPLSRYIVNCIASNNGLTGFTPNNAGGYGFNGHYYNNFSYHNGYRHSLLGYEEYYGSGFLIFQLATSPGINEMYANNVAYDNEYLEIHQLQNQVGIDEYVHEYNSWDTPPGVTITDADFVSLDTAQLRYSRKSDGSLPEITFGKLVSGSDLIDAGIDVGLHYAGIAPDLGYAEYEVADSTATDILTFTLPTQTGAATINAANHTVSIEVNYLATVTNLTPYISLSYGATISPASMVSRDFTTPQTYTVTALDGTTTQEWTVTVTQAEAPPPDPPEVDTSRIIKYYGGHLRKFRP